MSPAVVTFETPELTTISFLSVTDSMKAQAPQVPCFGFACAGFPLPLTMSLDVASNPSIYDSVFLASFGSSSLSFLSLLALCVPQGFSIFFFAWRTDKQNKVE